LAYGRRAVRIVAVERVPVLWITGPPGVGKSTVSWQIFTEIARAGVRVAFADADQLCICYPAPPGDPTRERIKARNVGALVPRYRAAGASCVIVNGCLDQGLYPELMPQAAVTVCRLRADRDELARRLVNRGAAFDEADDTDASDYRCVDTTGIAAAEVAALVRERCRDWPGFGSGGEDGDGDEDSDEDSGDEDPRDCSHEAGGKVLLICGPTGVGKSTVGFQLYLRLLRDGRTAGYVDLDQIGFVRPAFPGHRLRAGNLAAIWRTYRAVGATHLVATGPIDDEAALQAYLRALPAEVTVGRLHAGPAELTRRIMSRGEGGSWPQPGDPLRGQPSEYLLQVAARAIAQAAALERSGLGAIQVDADGLTAAEAADLIAGAWPGEPGR
jgi:predicted ABC-type ATPase